MLHVGDADPAADNFALLRSLPPIDLAFLPFYVSDDANRRLVADAIRPKRIVAMHVPPRDAPKIGALREANVGAQLAVLPDRPWRASADSGVGVVLEHDGRIEPHRLDGRSDGAASATAAMSPATRTIVDQSVGAIHS